MADEVIEHLRRWGHATVARFAMQEEGYSAGDNILARQRDLGLMTKKKRKVEHQPVGRAGEERRRFMAERMGHDIAGRPILHMLPAWAVDPVPCKNDADAPHDRPAAIVDVGIPDDLRWVESALVRLSREHPLRALVLREEFTGRGTQQQKAARVATQYGGALTLRQYRLELHRGMDWMRGRMTA